MLISCLVAYIRFNTYKGKIYSYWRTTLVFSFPSFLSYPLVFAFPLIVTFPVLSLLLQRLLPQPFVHYTIRISGTSFQVPWLTSTRNLWCLCAKKGYRHKHILILNWVFACFIFRKLILIMRIRKLKFSNKPENSKTEILKFEYSTWIPCPSQRCTVVAVSTIIISSFWKSC